MSQSLIWKIPTSEQKLYLTFDDGPIPHLTEEILAILKDFQAKASFFCVGENAKRQPGLIQKIQNEGHIIGNHSHHHMSGWKTSSSEYIRNVKKASEYIPSKLFRPPHGQISYQQIKRLKQDYKIIMWSVLSGDFELELSEEQCLFNVLQSQPGDIIVFHDNYKAQDKVLNVLPQFLQYYSEKGYRFEHLGFLEED